MGHKTFQVLEDPDNPHHLLLSREAFEIDRWISRRERACWLRLIAFQIIFGSLVWIVLFS